ncbi:hypothetical protein CTI12_AA067770 [Artemisia annua]|uniref:Uncharacterized protein n=1 Tax=Artemisia annua TaxID=35608 RepID=A0A2U1Q674_ARTAN|nr:hypothetical protein CTI12_AA067770 [Artemisia annua]
MQREVLAVLRELICELICEARFMCDVHVCIFGATRAYMRAYMRGESEADLAQKAIHKEDCYRKSSGYNTQRAVVRYCLAKVVRWSRRGSSTLGKQEEFDSRENQRKIEFGGVIVWNHYRFKSKV